MYNKISDNTKSFIHEQIDHKERDMTKSCDKTYNELDCLYNDLDLVL